MCVRVASWALDSTRGCTRMYLFWQHVRDTYRFVAACRVQLPDSGDALQLSLASILEAQARPCYKISHGSRHEHLAGSRSRGDAGADVDRDPRDLALVQLAFAHVNTNARRETELIERRHD